MKARPGGDERGQGRGAGIDYMPSMGHIEIPSHRGRGGAANGLVKRGVGWGWWGRVGLGGIDYMQSMRHIEIPSHRGRGGAANGLVKRGGRRG